MGARSFGDDVDQTSTRPRLASYVCVKTNRNECPFTTKWENLLGGNDMEGEKRLFDIPNLDAFLINLRKTNSPLPGSELRRFTSTTHPTGMLRNVVDVACGRLNRTPHRGGGTES